MRFVPLPGVFRPHSDSWMLADLVRRERLAPGAHVLDLCTGSGIVALAAAERDDRRVVAVDISRRSVLAVRLNSRLNGVRVEPRRGDLLDAVPGEQFDLIASNPPYVPGTDGPARGAARAWEGGDDGRRFLDRICREAPAHLKPGGALLLVHSAVCSEEATLSQLRTAGLRAEVIARHLGPPGKLMRERGLIDPDAAEEMVFVRGVRED